MFTVGLCLRELTESTSLNTYSVKDTHIELAMGEKFLKKKKAFIGYYKLDLLSGNFRFVNICGNT